MEGGQLFSNKSTKKITVFSSIWIYFNKTKNLFLIRWLELTSGAVGKIPNKDSDEDSHEFTLYKRAFPNSLWQYRQLNHTQHQM